LSSVHTTYVLEPPLAWFRQRTSLKPPVSVSCLHEKAEQSCSAEIKAGARSLGYFRSHEPSSPQTRTALLFHVWAVPITAWKAFMWAASTFEEHLIEQNAPGCVGRCLEHESVRVFLGRSRPGQ
jgi:hypothetical protein